MAALAAAATGAARRSRPCELSTSLLGSEVRTPIGVAPWAYQSLAHPDGERGLRAGAAAAGALMTVSTSASTPLADVAATEPHSPKWFQLYRLHSPAHTDDLARRAGQAGYRALVLTVDLPVLGRRLRDVANRFALPADLPLGNHPPRAAVPADSPVWTFDDIGRYAELSGLPVVVKGVLRGDDAVQCVQAGASAVWVSTHGGRQADPVVASAAALPEVADAVGDEVEVYADGGIRSGSDVLTALALGANAVFVGRPAIWGLATGGADGVSRVLAGLSAPTGAHHGSVRPVRCPLRAAGHGDTRPVIPHTRQAQRDARHRTIAHHGSRRPPAPRGWAIPVPVTPTLGRVDTRRDRPRDGPGPRGALPPRGAARARRHVDGLRGH